VTGGIPQHSGTEIIVALDVNDRKDLEKWGVMLQAKVNWVKVGMELFYAQGPAVIDFLKEKGFKVFLDLKLHDIPNTVEKAAQVLAKMGVDIFNLHTLGGTDMMKRTALTIKCARARVKIIGVTVLTSHSDRVLKDELSISTGMEAEVLHLASLAKDSGLDGVVCSPREVRKIKESCGRSFLTVVPGVRPVWADRGDQVRILTPGKAVGEGADYLVIGRPILQAPDPLKAIDLIREEMEDSAPGL